MNPTREKHYRILVYTWASLSAWAAMTHLFFPLIISNTWNWGLDREMQREIGIWNMGLLVILWQAMRFKISLSKVILPGMLTLSSLFAINHALSENWGGVILNLPPLVWAAMIKILTKAAPNGINRIS